MSERKNRQCKSTDMQEYEKAVGATFMTLVVAGLINQTPTSSQKKGELSWLR